MPGDCVGELRKQSRSFMIKCRSDRFCLSDMIQSRNCYGVHLMGPMALPNCSSLFTVLFSIVVWSSRNPRLSWKNPFPHFFSKEFQESGNLEITPFTVVITHPSQIMISFQIDLLPGGHQRIWDGNLGIDRYSLNAGRYFYSGQCDDMP